MVFSLLRVKGQSWIERLNVIQNTSRDKKLFTRCVLKKSYRNKKEERILNCVYLREKSKMKQKKINKRNIPEVYPDHANVMLYIFRVKFIYSNRSKSKEKTFRGFRFILFLQQCPGMVYELYNYVRLCLKNFRFNLTFSWHQLRNNAFVMQTTFVIMQKILQKMKKFILWIEWTMTCIKTHHCFPFPIIVSETRNCVLQNCVK